VRCGQKDGSESAVLSTCATTMDLHQRLGVRLQGISMLLPFFSSLSPAAVPTGRLPPRLDCPSAVFGVADLMIGIVFIVESTLIFRTTIVIDVKVITNAFIVARQCASAAEPHMLGTCTATGWPRATSLAGHVGGERESRCLQAPLRTDFCLHQCE